MNCYIKHIAVIDKNAQHHTVTFTRGVNVITGGSSTGKSAMIEIFDYCFGSSEFTIPEGVITQNSEWYIVVMNFETCSLILARKSDKGKAILREATLEFTSDINNLSLDFLNSCDLFSKNDFNKKLSNYFGIKVIDTEENKSDKKFRGGYEKPRPSIRNGISFLLQHQNLVANKHALFYRFDQKQKREQTIDQFKIFSGLVDQEYYDKMQEIAELKERKLKLENDLENKNEILQVFKNKAIDLFLEYEAITGIDIQEKWQLDVTMEPKQTLRALKENNVAVDYDSDKYSKILRDLEIEKNSKYNDIRDLETRLRKIKSSINYAENFNKQISELEQEQLSDVPNCICPFCNTDNSQITDAHNRLSDAVEWLNGELFKTRLTVDNYHREKKTLQDELILADKYFTSANDKYEQFKAINKSLAEKNSLEKQAEKVIWKIESHLEEQIDLNIDKIEQSISTLDKNIIAKNKKLIDSYNVVQDLRDAKEKIETYMNNLKDKFEFEKEYLTGNLRFDLDSFDLYFEKENK